MAPPRNRRPGFSRRAQYSLFLVYVLTVAGALIGVVALLLSIYQPKTFSWLTAGAREVTTPVSSGLDSGRRFFGGIPKSVSDYWGVAAENKRLRKRIEDDAALIQRARALSAENRRLRVLARLRDRAVEPVVSARLVSSSATSTRRFAILNAGFVQGVHSGQPVRGPEGLVGQVLEVGPNSARVMLLTDPESIIPVRRTRDGLPAIVVGRGDGLLDVKTANDANVPLLAGDNFITSGTGGIYPPGIPVARVLRTARDSAMGRPFAHPDNLDFALVQKAFVPELANPGSSPLTTQPAEPGK